MLSLGTVKNTATTDMVEIVSVDSSLRFSMMNIKDELMLIVKIPHITSASTLKGNDLSQIIY